MIEVKHLRKAFDDATVPLRDVNVTINNGDVISIIGPSGTGKSTFLRCLNMLTEPTSGQIIVNGEDITQKGCNLSEVRMKMGMVFQSFNLFGHLTVIENIMNPQITLLGRTRQEAYDKAMYHLTQVGLATKALNYPEELSGGQQQRIAIARTLAMDPDVILFDEPTSALDPSMIGEVQSVIKLLAKTGRTMLIVTHEMEFARKIANRVFFMYDGEVYEEGTPRQIFGNPKREATRKFIQRLSSLTYRINKDQDFDPEKASEEFQAYGEKLLIESERLSKVSLALEEICINNIKPNSEEPDVLITIEYSEKYDILKLDIRYKGAYYDPKTSESEMFQLLLAEPTTTMKCIELENDASGFEHEITISLGWQED